MEINIDGWNKVNKFEDCAPLNKKVLAIHDSKLYIATFEMEGNEGYCWGLENERGLEWVDIFDVDAWISVENLGNTNFSDIPNEIREEFKDTLSDYQNCVNSGMITIIGEIERYYYRGTTFDEAIKLLLERHKDLYDE